MHIYCYTYWEYYMWFVLCVVLFFVCLFWFLQNLPSSRSCWPPWSMAPSFTRSCQPPRWWRAVSTWIPLTSSFSTPRRTKASSAWATHPTVSLVHCNGNFSLASPHSCSVRYKQTNRQTNPWTFCGRFWNRRSSTTCRADNSYLCYTSERKNRTCRQRRLWIKVLKVQRTRMKDVGGIFLCSHQQNYPLWIRENDLRNR